MKKGTNTNHPIKGSSIRVDPIKELKDIKEIKKLLEPHPLYLCLFVLGINTNLRACDLLSIKVSQVSGLIPMEEIVLKERKTGKERRISLNQSCIDSIEGVLGSSGVVGSVIKGKKKDLNREYLFTGKRGTPWTVPSISSMVKKWCKQVGLTGNFGAHTLRKTWAYQQYTNFGVSVPVLMKCLNHSSEKQVLTYIGIQEEEVKQVFGNEI